MPLPLLPMKEYVMSARKTWWPYLVEDAEYPDHRVGWASLKREARELGVSTSGHIWNSKKSKLSLANKIIKAKISAVKVEWSRKISSGRYEVL